MSQSAPSLPQTQHPQPAQVADDLREGLSQFLLPLLALLDACLDVRLVRTFLATVETVLSFRNRAHGLLLSELGAYLLGPHQAPAGTKRLSNLLRSSKWSADLIEQYLWGQAKQRHEQLQAAGEETLVLWDESVIEKPESRNVEGLCPLRRRWRCCGALGQSRAPGALTPCGRTSRQAHLCQRTALGQPAAAGNEQTAYHCGTTLVQHARPRRYSSARGAVRLAQRVHRDLGTPGAARL